LTNAQFVSLFALLKNSKKPEQMTLAKLSIKVVIASLFLIIQTSIYNTTQAQIPAIEWQNTIGGNDYDELKSIIQTTDGGYLLGGVSWSSISGDKTENSQGNDDYWVVKTDDAGTITWQNTIGGTGSDALTSIIQTTDGGYLLGGQSSSNISGDKTENSQGNDDYWVVKIDAAGSITWQNTIGGSSDDELNSIIQTTDGGYLLGGWSQSSISGDKTENSQGYADYWVVKIDATGSITWQNTIGGDGWNELNSIIQTTDGGYLLGGQSTSNISGDKTENAQGSWDYWVVKIDAAGSITWQNTIGGSSGDELKSIIQTTDGGYLLGGYSESSASGDKTENSQGNDDYWVVKIDAAGTITWQSTIGGSQKDELKSIIQTTDGGYLLGGYSYSSSSGDKTENSQGARDYWVVKIDAAGSILWQNTIGGSFDDELKSIIQTTDGGYLLGGHSTSNISGDKTENTQGGVDYWVVKLASEPSAGCTDSSACNYDATASVDDGSCEVLSCAGCTDSNACNYDITATIEDGSCEAISCAGCTDSNACNYDITATIEDSSCLVIGISCDDGDLSTSNDTIDANCNCVGTPNNALSFDPSNSSWMEISEISGFTPDNFTIEIWMYFDSFSGYRTIFHIGNDVQSDFEIYTQGSARIAHVSNRSNGAGGGSHITESPIPTNQWFLYSMSYSSINGINVYFDGVLKSSSAINPASISPDAKMYLGYQPSNSWGHCCPPSMMDEVRIWNEALSTSQILNNTTCQMQGVEDKLFAYYSLNQGIAAGDNTGLTTVIDNTGNGHDGELVNFSLNGASSNWTDGSAGIIGNCAVTIGCSDSMACNYDSAVTVDDGSCEVISCAGCTDGNACNYNITATIDDGSCLVIGMLCDDGDLCTSNDTIDANCNCVGTPSNCDDGNPCTDDTCDPINGGCTYAPVADGMSCDDGDPATTSVCLAGSCTLVVVDLDVDGYDSTVDCDDNNPDVYPNAPELCDGLDNDCDGVIDEGLDADSDGDSLSDCDELLIYLTDPLDADSDNDGLTDGLEVNHSGTNPLMDDTDGDGCSDDLEFSLACPDSECVPPVNPCIGDFSGDGSVNVSDLGGFLGAFGTTCE